MFWYNGNSRYNLNPNEANIKGGIKDNTIKNKVDFVFNPANEDFTGFIYARAPKTNKNVPAPMFSRIYTLKSVENTGSFTWHGYRVSLARKVDNASLYQMAKEFHNSLKKSNAAADAQEESNY